MLDQLDLVAMRLGLDTQTLLIGGIAAGSMMTFLGLAATVTGRNPGADRIAALRDRRRSERMDGGILRAPSQDPRGLMKSFVPSDMSQRVRLTRQLARAGFAGPRALEKFQMVRLLLGLVLPGMVLLVLWLARMPEVVLPLPSLERLAELSNFRLLQVFAVLTALGYYGPLLWLRDREKERTLRITESFPNALDLMRVSVEAGLGFDAAMTRVGNELAKVSPEIAWEFLSVQRQVQAGRPRQDALADMAERTGVETVRSFANVVGQSMQFGTPMSEALSTYAEEMRAYREMAAQEMANKLPVKMSAVLASLMLPALILLTIGPVVIRYIRMFSG